MSEVQLPINQRIRAPRVFLIDENGQPVGEVDTSLAMQKAEALELDLVLVGPQAHPPVAKILDYGKYKYEQERKERKNKAKKSVDLKEIRLTYTTDEHDFETKLNQAKRFLAEGHRIKLRLKLYGREMAFREKAMEQLARFRDAVGLEYEANPMMQGKQIIVTLKEKKS